MQTLCRSQDGYPDLAFHDALALGRLGLRTSRLCLLLPAHKVQSAVQKCTEPRVALLFSVPHRHRVCSDTYYLVLR